MGSLRILFFIILGTLLFNIGNGQVRCATEEIRNGTPHEPDIIFEDWLRNKLEERISPRILRTEAVVQVPVVVHVIHFGENYGEGRNIPDEQVLSQIQVLNEDFRRTNPDQTNTPAEFLPVAADIEIDFVLAKQDPEGLPTTGINRVNGGKSNWSWEEQSAMKNLSQWPPEEYINIWVADLVISGQNLLGFATFPETGLTGVPFGSSPENDGLAIDYTVFGSEDIYPQGNYNSNFSKGRTTTHEMGHFFGLRHIWGDINGCSGTDFCDDTPNQSSDTSGCPSGIIETCGVNDMYMNYMDYTQDACMNIFTEDQKARMITVLNNSPRRSSLSSSHALTDPVSIPDDAGISEIITPGFIQCPGTMTPRVEVRNYGSQTINSVEIRFLQNGGEVQLKSFSPGISTLDRFIAEFDPVTVVSSPYSFEIVTVNGNPDNNTVRNTQSVSVDVSTTTAAPFIQDFESSLGDWTTLNRDSEIGWQIRTAPNSSPSNQAIQMEFHQYENPGEMDYLLSPVFDLSTAESPYLSFDMAYRSFSGTEGDALLIAAIPNCQFSIGYPTMLQFDTLYYQTGPDMQTVTPSSGSYFTPSDAQDWQTIPFISLDKFKGVSELQLVFVSVNGYGNNLYLDNIQVNTTSNLDLSVSEVLTPGRVTCESDLTPSLLITNSGTNPVNSFNISYTINGGNFQELVFSNVNLQPGQSGQAFLNPVTFSEGDYLLEASISEVNGIQDDNSANNTINYAFTVNSEIMIPPGRESFDNGVLEDWYSISDNPSLAWTPADESIRVSSYNNFDLGAESWLVSPAYDFSLVEEASIFFDLAYSKLNTGSETLYFITSEDCGTTFDNIIYSRSGELLSTANPVTDFTPAPEDWQEQFIELNSLAGNEKIRFAFVSINGGGNNLYLDQLELFMSDNPDPLDTEENITRLYPNPTSSGLSKLTFNLEEGENVIIKVTDRMGKGIFNGKLDNALNQTIEIDLSNESQGLYIVNILGETFSRSYRLVVNK